MIVDGTRYSSIVISIFLPVFFLIFGIQAFYTAVMLNFIVFHLIWILQLIETKSLTGIHIRKLVLPLLFFGIFGLSTLYIFEGANYGDTSQLR